MTIEPREAQPGQGLWSKLTQAVEEMPEPTADLWATLEDKLDFTKLKPGQRAGVEVSRQQTAQGTEFYILHNPNANTYLKLEPQDYFLWELLDGQHSIRDLAVAYFCRFQAFPFDRLVHLMAQLKDKELLEAKPVQVFGAVAHHFTAQTLAYRLQRFSETSMQKEFGIKGADGFFDALYKRVAWPLFKRQAVPVYGAVALIGLALFVRTLLAGTYPIVGAAGSLGRGLVVLLLAQYIMTFFHECGHAMSCKAYGRRVPKGGMMFYYGSPAWFVDTTDIWMAPKRARLIVSFAGPATDLVVSGLVATVVTLFPGWPLSAILFQVTLVGYVGVLMNLAPFLELDGYFLLMDWLEIPLLRIKSVAFVRERLLRKLVKERSAFSREERIFAVYGLLAAIWTALTMLLTVYLWQSQLQVMIRDVLSGRDILAAVLVGGLALMAGIPLILGLAIKAALLVDQGLTRLRRGTR
jgi:putative peptide zinc metalloprotease protein